MVGGYERRRHSGRGRSLLLVPAAPAWSIDAVNATVSTRRTRRLAGIVLATAMMPAQAGAEDAPHAFAGALFGVSTLSADARSVTTTDTAAVSLYDPRNGPAVNLFAGVHIAEYFSLQANWMWNRNDITLLSVVAAPQGSGFYEQQLRTRQHAAVLDGLVYFRGRASRVRPYLATGLSLLRFTSDEPTDSRPRGLAPPSGRIASTQLGVRSHVGIDLRRSRRVSARYSFSETISGNPIGEALTPPGKRGLMNFQNLFGVVCH